MKHFFVNIILFLSIGLSQSTLQNASIHSDEMNRFGVSSLCDSPWKENRSECQLYPQIFTEEQMAAQLEKMRTMYPDEYQRMLMPKPLNKTYKIGMTEKFWVNVDDGNGGTKLEEITAQLLAKGNRNAIWADVTQINESNNIDNNSAIEYLEFLEEKTPSTSVDSTKGSWELVTTYFGNEPNYDGDNITDYLFADIYAGAAGYFSPSDQSNGSGSNRRDILYIDCNVSNRYAKSTIAHEHQHLIHSNYYGKGRSFNEGMSEMAIVITGYGSAGFNPNNYLSRVGSVGWEWEGESVNYSMTGLFVLYFAEQLGYESLLKFQEINATDWSAFQRLLNLYDAGMNYQSWIQNWHIANYLNDKDIEPYYGYDYSDVGNASSNKWHTTGAVESDELTISNFDVNYIYYSSSVDSLPITFTGLGALGYNPNYKSLEYTDNGITIKSLENQQEHIVKDDTYKVNSAVFVVSNLNPVDTKYRYVSTGENTGGWYASTEIGYDDGNVDVFTLSSGGTFGYFGCGGVVGCGWGVAFDPVVSENQLIGVSINLGFAQDFSSGASIPASADKDFDLHIWTAVGEEDENGVRQTVDVMNPIKINAKTRGINGIGWVNIDLSPYSKFLTNLDEIIIGAVEDDTNGVYFGMSSDSPTKNYTYIYGGNTVGPITNTSVSGGDQLDGWNLMFRSQWLVKNTVIPELHAGFVQHSIFNDELNIYLLGNSQFDSENTNVYVTNNNEVQYLTLNPLVSNDSTLLANYKLKNAGSLDIRVSGSYLYSTIPYDTTFNYNVGYADLTKPLITSSRDNIYQIQLPEQSFDKETYIVVGKNGFISDSSIDLENILSEVYTVGPIQKDLNVPAQISFELSDVNIEDVSIGFWDGESWRELQTTISSNKKSLRAVSSTLGHFALIKKGSTAPLSISEEALIPTEYALSQNYPNPFNPETRISYDIINSGNVSINIFDILGRKITTLVNEYKAPGRYNVIWKGNDANGNPVGSGVYLYQLKSGSYSKTKKMVLSR